MSLNIFKAYQTLVICLFSFVIFFIPILMKSLQIKILNRLLIQKSPFFFYWYSVLNFYAIKCFNFFLTFYCFYTKKYFYQMNLYFLNCCSSIHWLKTLKEQLKAFLVPMVHPQNIRICMQWVLCTFGTKCEIAEYLLTKE